MAYTGRDRVGVSQDELYERIVTPATAWTEQIILLFCLTFSLGMLDVLP